MAYRIDYFEIPTGDTEKSRAFMAKVFGWSIFDFGDSYSEIRDAGMLGGLNGDAGDKSAAPMLVIHADDIEKAERDVVAAGGVITRETYNYPGGKRFLFREPGGAELAVYVPGE